MEGGHQPDRSSQDGTRGLKPNSGTRLNRYLASCGLGSRRSCETLVREGRVRIDGKRIRNLARRVEPGESVFVDDRAVRPRGLLTIALHKPGGHLTTAADPRGRPTVYDLLPSEWDHLRYVGRLDRDTEGLLILTSDGDLAMRLAHPRHGAEKEYEIRVNRTFCRDHVKNLLEGIELTEGTARAERVEILSRQLIRIVLKQGWKRQIRRMLKSLGYEVRHLIRIRVGGLELRELRQGKWQVLSPEQVALLEPGKGKPNADRNDD